MYGVEADRGRPGRGCSIIFAPKTAKYLEIGKHSPISSLFVANLDLQNINVVVSILHNFPDQRLKNKSIFSKYFEIFLDTPRKILFKRDQKKIYSRFKKNQIKNVVGLDIEFKKPSQPNITLNGNTSTKINIRDIRLKNSLPY